MTEGAVLIGVGVMLALSGVALAAAMLAGIDLVPARSGRERRNSASIWLTPQTLVAAAGGLATLLVTGWPAAALAAAGAVVLLPSVLGDPGATAVIARQEALASWTRRLADLLASGAAGSLDVALRLAAATTPPAIASETNALVMRMAPQGVETALRRFAEDLDDPSGDLVAAALILRARHGGRGLAQVLTGLANDLDERVRMAREVEAERAKPRSNVRVMVLFTVGLAAALLVFARSFLEPYSTAVGQLCLAGVVGVFACALLWLKRLSRPVTGPRFLQMDPTP